MMRDLIAAIDLGSNSFRLQVGRIVNDQIYPLDGLKEAVRLAAGLSPDKKLDLASQQRGVAALQRFQERLRDFPAGRVRAVATNTLRVAKNAQEFLIRAEAALGIPIEVIAGREEARLIYVGVAHTLPDPHKQQLVVDIGGGSTEFIVGKSFEPLLLESRYMGCVGFSMRFFPEGRIDKRSMKEAELAARRELQTISAAYREAGWEEAVGSSGTAKALLEILEQNGFSRGGITRDGLEQFKAALLRAGSVDAVDLAGLKGDRLPVILGGFAIMSAVFKEFNLEHMVFSEGALRLGVLYDLLGRFHHHDMRDSTVQQFMHRYQVDARQAERVERTAFELLSQLIRIDWPENERDVNFLRWAALLHEIGISIAHSGFHRHGAYIARFADMPGFSKMDQERLALLLLGQRGKLEKLPVQQATDPVWRLVFCLRLSTLLHRSRDDQGLPVCFVRQSGTGFQVELPGDWLAANPLSAATLNDEALLWQRAGAMLKIKRRSASYNPE